MLWPRRVLPGLFHGRGRLASVRGRGQNEGGASVQRGAVAADRPAGADGRQGDGQGKAAQHLHAPLAPILRIVQDRFGQKGRGKPALPQRDQFNPGPAALCRQIGTLQQKLAQGRLPRFEPGDFCPNISEFIGRVEFVQGGLRCRMGRIGPALRKGVNESPNRPCDIAGMGDDGCILTAATYHIHLREYIRPGTCRFLHPSATKNPQPGVSALAGQVAPPFLMWQDGCRNN